MQRSTATRLLLAAAAVAIVLAAATWASRRVNASRGMAITRVDGARLALLQAGAVAGQASGEATEISAASLQETLASMRAARKLVRTAALTVEIGDYADAARRAASVATAHGGYLAGERLAREPGDRPRGTLTLRVPADHFDEAIAGLKSLGRVESLELTTQDISREYADLATRLEAKRAAELRMRELLRTSSARLADLVEAEKEDARLIEEIDRLEGERRYDDAVEALSVVTLELHEPAAFVRDNAFTPLASALRQALPLLSGSVAAMLYALAAGAPWALLAILLWKLRRRFRTPPRPVALRTES